MNKVNQLNKKNAGLLGAIFGGLIISVPATPIAASAQDAVLNPCPRIYYEEPFNSTNLVPEGCPSNAITQQLRADVPDTPNTITSENAPPQPGIL